MDPITILSAFAPVVEDNTVFVNIFKEGKYE